MPTIPIPCGIADCGQVPMVAPHNPQSFSGPKSEAQTRFLSFLYKCKKATIESAFGGIRYLIDSYSQKCLPIFEECICVSTNIHKDIRPCAIRHHWMWITRSPKAGCAPRRGNPSL